MPLSEAVQRTDAWLSARRGKITASLAAACLGLDPHTSRQKAWRTILGMEKRHSNKHTNWGEENEPVARLEYEIETGNIVEETGLWVHPGFPWLAASPDGLVGPDGVVEIKCPTYTAQSVPLHHRIQMLIQLACTERKWAHYYSWGVDKETRQPTRFFATVKRAGIVGLIVKLGDFYDRYVATGVEPPKRPRKRR